MAEIHKHILEGDTVNNPGDYSLCISFVFSAMLLTDWHLC